MWHQHWLPAFTLLDKRGGGSAHFHQIKVQQIALERWDTALFHNSWITPVHIAGEDNQLTDYLSCHKMGQADYGLRKEVHSRVCSSFFTPSFDLFFSPELHVATRGAPPPASFYGRRCLLATTMTATQLHLPPTSVSHQNYGRAGPSGYFSLYTPA